MSARPFGSSPPPPPTGLGMPWGSRTLFTMVIMLFVVGVWVIWPRVQEKLDGQGGSGQAPGAAPAGAVPEPIASPAAPLDINARALVEWRKAHEGRARLNPDEAAELRRVAEAAGDPSPRPGGEARRDPTTILPDPRERNLAEEADQDESDKLKFIPPSAEFEPLERLSRDALLIVHQYDEGDGPHTYRRGDVSNLKNEASAWHHIFRFLRTVESKALLSPQYVSGPVEGVAAHEQPLLAALSDEPRTRAELARNAPGVQMADDVLDRSLARFVDRDIAVTDVTVYRRKARTNQSLTPKGEIVYGVLPEGDFTVESLVEAVSKAVHQLPTPFVRGRRAADSIESDLQLAILDVLQKAKDKAADNDAARVTDVQLAQALGMELQDVLNELRPLVLAGYVVALHRTKPWMDDKNVIESELIDMEPIGLVERLPTRYKRGKKQTGVVPDELLETYATIQKGITSLRYLQIEKKLSEEEARRQLKVLGDAGLIRRARKLKYSDVMIGKTIRYRGRVMSFRGVYRRRHKLVEWPDTDRYKSGVRHSWMVYITDLEKRNNTYAVLMMEDPATLGLRDEASQVVQVIGLYVKKWPELVSSDGKQTWWRDFPLLAAKEVRLLPPPPSSMGYLHALIVIVGAAGLALLFFGARRDSAAAREHKDHLEQRQRRARERSRDRQQKATASGGEENADNPGNGEAPATREDSTADAAAADEPDASEAAGGDASDDPAAPAEGPSA